MFAVAIDGPSGAGKSSVSKAVAQRLGFIYVDTGALYRTVALYLIRHGISPEDVDAVTAALPCISVEMKHEKRGQRMLLCGEDVTDQIRTGAVSTAASVSSAIPAVRQFLFKLQTDMAEKYNVVMDGRDIGTVVLPHAQVKIFLTASAEERARRRMAQLRHQGVTEDYDTVLREIKERDERDSSRELAPLKPCEGAVLVDSTNNKKMRQTVDIICDLIKEKLKRDWV